MTRADFETLASPTEGVHVSLFLPTHRVGTTKDADADRLRWKNLLTAVEAALVEDGTDRRRVEELLAPAWDLHGDGMAWSHMSDGLAAFLRPGMFRSFRVPLEMPELVAVGTGFILGPALPLLTDQTFLVLALSQKKVRVLRGSRNRVGELDLPGVPTAFEDVFAPEGPKSDTVPRPRSSGRSGGAGAIYHGSGVDDMMHIEDLTEYFRTVADGVHQHLGGRTVPMVLAGLPESVAVYREVNRYPHLLPQAIERNPDDLSVEDLRAAAWELVEQRLAEQTAHLLDRFHEQRARGGGASGHQAVLTAAQEGRVDTMLITPDGCWGPGHGTDVVRLGGIADDPCEHIDAAAMATLRTGGAVRVLEELPDGANVAAVLRY